MPSSSQRRASLPAPIERRNAARAAAENNNPKASLRWAEIAYGFAQRDRGEGDPERARNAVLLDLARCVSSLSSKDMPTARTAAQAAVDAAEKSLPPGDSDRAAAGR